MSQYYNTELLRGVISADYYADGCLKSCRLGEENIIQTVCGELVPQYGEENVRRKFTKSLSFYESGAVKSISLENQTEVLTQLGSMPAELVSFYESGELKRIFPRNGKISGYWTIEDEANLLQPMEFDFECGSFTVKIVGVHFFKSGKVKSVTLFPGETVRLRTPTGEIPVQNGFSLYEDGAIKSLEPAMPVPVKTAIGVFEAYDVNAVGINADKNSLVFDSKGNIKSLMTSTDKLAVYTINGKTDFFAPVEKELDEGESYIIPLTFTFDTDSVTIRGEEEKRYLVKECLFQPVVGSSSLGGCSRGSCAGCPGCS